MPLTDYDKTKLAEFFEEIGTLLPAYMPPVFRYMAVQCNGEWVIFQGRARLSWAPPESFKPFVTPDVRVEELAIGADASCIASFLDKLLEGRIELDGTSYAFPVNHAGHHSSYHAPFDGMRKGAAAGQFSLTGSNGHYHFSQSPKILRALRANPISFDSIEALAHHYSLPWDSMNVRVEVEASAIARFLPGCVLADGKATLKVQLAEGLKQDRLFLNTPARVIGGPYPHPELPPIRWQARTEGEAEFDAPDISALTCLLTYDGLVQSELTMKNTPKYDILRFAYDTLDRKSAFGAAIDNDEVSGRNTRELEDVVAASLAMLGFRTAALDHVPGFNDAPDVLAADDRGNLLAVECTISLPKPEEKIDLAFRKSALLRRAMDKAGLDHLNVIAILAVAQPENDLNMHMPIAGRRGVLLWGRETLHRIREPAASATVDEIYDAFANDRDVQSLAFNAQWPTDVS